MWHDTERQATEDETDRCYQDGDHLLRGIGNMASGFPLFGTGSNHHTPLHVQVKK